MSCFPNEPDLGVRLVTELNVWRVHFATAHRMVELAVRICGEHSEVEALGAGLSQLCCDGPKQGAADTLPFELWSKVDGIEFCSFEEFCLTTWTSGREANNAGAFYGRNAINDSSLRKDPAVAGGLAFG